MKFKLFLACLVLTMICSAAAVTIVLLLDNNEIITAENVIAENNKNIATLIDTMKKNDTPPADSFKMNGSEIPHDNQYRYYLTINENANETLKKASFTCGDYTIILPEELFSIYIKNAVAAGTKFPVYFVKDNAYFTASLILTTMPIIQIDMEDGESPDSIKHGDENDDSKVTVSVYSAEVFVKDHVKQIVSESANIHVRGGSAKYYPKKSYKFSFKDDTGLSLNQSLLNMRSDDDWVLLAAYTDSSKMREMLGIQIWNAITSGTASMRLSYDMQYVEMILDGEYNGIYILQEAVDAKQYDAVEGDMIAKCHSWDYPNKAEGTLGGFEIKYPKDTESEEVLAKGLETLYTYTDFVTQWDGNYFKEHYQNVVNVDNIIDYFLFISLIGATDNKMNNIYYYAQPDETGIHLSYAPWDLDCSFGYYNWINIHEDGTVSQDYLDRSNEFEMQETLIIQHMMRFVPDEFNEMITKRWNELRRRVLTVQDLCSMVYQLRDTLEASGAYARDEAVWGGVFHTYEDEADYLAGFLRNRLDDIDSWINNREWMQE